MFWRTVGRRARRRNAGLFAAALVGAVVAAPAHSADPDTTTYQLKTATPIKHVIVVIAENRSFDHVYGTYVPKSGASILNLLSERIVRKNGNPGLRCSAAVRDVRPDELLHRRQQEEQNPLPDIACPNLRRGAECAEYAK